MYSGEVRCKLRDRITISSVCDGEISEEEGEDAYCYRGEAGLTKELVDDFGSELVSNSLDKSEGNSEGTTEDIFKEVD